MMPPQDEIVDFESYAPLGYKEKTWYGAVVANVCGKVPLLPILSSKLIGQIQDLNINWKLADYFGPDTAGANAASLDLT